MSRSRAIASLVLSLAFATGCGIFSLGPKQSQLQKEIGGTHMSGAELRLRVRSLALPFSGELETMADAVAATTNDPALKRALLQFKINAIPQMQDALLRTDPVASLVDAWALVLQLRNALRQVDPRLEIPPEVDATFADMERQLADLWRQMTGKEDVTGIRDTIARWAAEHPLESLATRPTTRQLLADVTARAGLTPIQAANELLETTQDVVERLDVQSAFLPKQGRWQAELLLRQMLADPSIFGTLQNQENLLAALNQALATAATAPRWTQDEMRFALQTLHDERLQTQDYVSAERAAVVDALHAERIAAMDQANQVGAQLVDRAFARADALVDRVLLRLLIFAAVVLALGLLLVLLLLRRFDRRGRLVARRRPAEA